MQNELRKAKVILTGDQMQKFLQKINTDSKFSKTYSAIMKTGDENRLAQFLRKNGFKLG